MASTPSAAITLDAVTHRYGTQVALQNVSFNVQVGAFHALLGPNGSGKTTLFRILNTLLRPTEGRAGVFGLDVATQPDAVRRRFGTVFQHAALDEHLTVGENLSVQAALYGLSARDGRDRASALLEALGLSSLTRRAVKTLSGGEKRRADLARALIHQPDLLLLDEPTTALDPTARRRFHELLASLRAREGVTILMATHLLEEADEASAITILNEGQVVAQGDPETLKRSLGRETLWITPIPDSALDMALPTLDEATFTRVGARLRVEHARPADALAHVAAAYPDAIDSATVRRPTLDDVFFAATGTQYASEN